MCIIFLQAVAARGPPQLDLLMWKSTALAYSVSVLLSVCDYAFASVNTEWVGGVKAITYGVSVTSQYYITP